MKNFQTLPEQSLLNFSLINKSLIAWKLRKFAAIVDAGKQFVQATYKLEGDGPLVFQVYEIISALSTCTSITMENYPNVQAVVKNISWSTKQQLEWRKYARQCIKPALDNEHLQAVFFSFPG